MIKLLIGGSPCTSWSIAKTNNRETKPEGIGWELFRNYLIAREKYKPDYFLYENNKSAAQPIKDQISCELGVPLQYINSALVSAQNRQRFYAHNIPDVPQPEDRGILLRDVLETGEAWRDKAYTLDANYYKTLGQIGFDTQAGRRKMVAEAVGACGTRLTDKARTLRACYCKTGQRDVEQDIISNGQFGATGAIEPIEYIPLASCDVITSDQGIRCAYKDGGSTAQGYHVDFIDNKSRALISGHASKMKVIVPTKAISGADGKTYPVYEVRGGLITIRDKQYPIRLADGYYIIRKLTVTECKRLQTVPDSYIFPVSNTQAYKMLGNAWTVDVIAHILSHIPGIRSEPVEVLSMYDGMSCGRIALGKLGANVTRYYASEIDKHAIQTTMANYPDTVQIGDAFRVREDGWRDYL